MWFIFLIYFGLFFSFVIILDKWTRRMNKKHMEFLKLIPGPISLPLLGSALKFRRPTDLMVRLIEYKLKYGNVWKIWLGSTDLKIVFSGHEAAGTLLSSMNVQKSPDYNFLKNWLGEGLLTSKASRWKKHRKALTPAFHYRILEHFVDNFEVPTKTLIKKFGTLVGKKDVDVHPFMSLCSLDIICETSMGISVNAQEDDASEYVNAVSEIGRIAINRALSPLKNIDFFYRLSRDYHKEKAALKILHSYTNEVIQQRKNIIAQMKKGNKNEDIFDSETKLTFLDILLTSEIDGKPIPDEAIREEVDTFMFEGHDTVSSALAFTLYLLANHPEQQRKAYEEQRELLGDEKNPKVTLNDLKRMDYLELVIKESLRLYPPVPILGRESTEDMEIGGLTYPKGLKYYVSVLGVHRNEEHFENSMDFDPTRFLDLKERSPFAYLPFSAGPRNCIGQKFAMLEMKYVISAVIRNFRLEPADPNEELQLCLKLILKSENGIKISLQMRP